MVDFMNEAFSCYQKAIEFVFELTLPGTEISYGYFILACVVFILVVSYILRSIR